ERVARRDGVNGAGGVFYYFSDHLKTASVITDSAGTIKAESDYYPWGGELQFVANDSNHYKFTGKERDNESGLDYFGARYYSNGLGRWISADWSATPEPIPYAELADPQSFNLYSYVRNIPTSRIDLDGHDGPSTAILPEPPSTLPEPTIEDWELIDKAGEAKFGPVIPGVIGGALLSWGLKIYNDTEIAHALEDESNMERERLEILQKIHQQQQKA